MNIENTPKPAAAALSLLRQTLAALVGLTTLMLSITLATRAGLRRTRHYLFYRGRPGHVHFQCPSDRAPDSNQATMLVRMGTGRHQVISEIPVWFDNIHYSKLTHIKNRQLHQIFSRALDEGMSPVGLCMEGMVLSPYTAHKICERELGAQLEARGIVERWVSQPV